MEEAKHLQLTLERLGFDVWRDQTRLETDWSREISLALISCEVACVLWSEKSSQSQWVRNEWLTARAIGKDIVFCFLDQHRQLPDPLSNLHGLVMTDHDFTSKLGKRLRLNRGKFIDYDYSIIPKNIRIPFNPYPGFVGREEDLNNLYLLNLKGLNSAGTTRIGITGMGGIGKTQLAVEFAYRYAFAYKDGILWIQSTGKNSWASQIAIYARDQLHLQIQNPSAEDAESQYVQCFQEYCSKEKHMLVVIDNVSDATLLHDEAILGGPTIITLGCNVLFTTRDRIDIPGVTTYHLDKLNDQDAFKMLTSGRPPEIEEENVAKEICNAVGYLPLALIIASGYLKSYPEVNYKEYLQALGSDKIGTLDEMHISQAELATRHEAAVAATLRPQLLTLKDIDIEVFNFASLLPESSIIPKARVRIALETDNVTKPTKRWVTDSINTLVRQSLVEELGTSRDLIRLHPLVRALINGSMSDDMQHEIRVKAAELINIAYSENKRLFSEYQRRDIDEVIEDIAIAKDWADINNIKRDVVSLYHILNRERVICFNHNLAPFSFFQQLQSRSASLAMSTFSDRFSKELSNYDDQIYFHFADASKSESLDWVRLMEGHTAFVYAIDITSDGKKIISGSDDGTAIIWDAGTGKILRRFSEHKGAVRGVSISPDGLHALSGSLDGNVLFWKCNTGEILQSLKAHSGYIATVKILDDGRKAMTSSQDGLIIFWDLESGTQLFSFKCNEETSVMKFWLSRDERQIFALSLGSAILSYNASTGQLLKRIEDSTLLSRVFCISDTGQALIGSYSAGALSLVDVISGEKIATFPGPYPYMSEASFSPDGTFVVGGKKSDLVVFDMMRDEPIRVLDGHSGEIMSVAISGNGHSVATGKTDWSVALWDLNAPQPANQRNINIRGHKEFSYIRVAVNENGNLAAVLHQDDSNIGVTLWDPIKLMPIDSKIIDLGSDFAYNPHDEHGFCLSKDGKFLATGMFGYFNVWNTADAGLVLRGKTHGWVDQLKFSGDGGYIYLTDASEVIRWNLKSQTADLWMESAHTKSFSSIDLDSTGKLLVSGGFDDLIYLTDIEKQKIIYELHGHESWIVAVKFIKSSMIMSASSDHTLMVWDVETGKALRRIDCGAQLKSALLMANNRHALTIAHDNSLAIWDLLTGDLCRKVILVSDPYSIAIAGPRLLLTDTAGVLRAIDIFKGKESIL